MLSGQNSNKSSTGQVFFYFPLAAVFDQNQNKAGKGRFDSKLLGIPEEKIHRNVDFPTEMFIFHLFLKNSEKYHQHFQCEIRYHW